MRWLIAFVLIGAVAADCDYGFFGEDCMSVCGFCLSEKGDPVTCSMVDGACPTFEDKYYCKPGWNGTNCKQPICNPGCNSGYECIGPNTCDCGEDINIVGPQCEDIRVRGVIGSIAAFATVTASISLCGLGSKLYKRRKEGASL